MASGISAGSTMSMQVSITSCLRSSRLHFMHLGAARKWVQAGVGGARKHGADRAEVSQDRLGGRSRGSRTPVGSTRVNCVDPNPGLAWAGPTQEHGGGAFGGTKFAARTKPTGGGIGFNL